MERSTKTRRRAVVALVGAAALIAVSSGCRRPGTGGTWPTTTAPTTTMPSGDHGHGGGGDDHGTGGHGGSGGHGDGGSHDIPDRLNHPPTAEQKAAADKLVQDNKRINGTRFATTAQAEAAGYINIGDGASGVIHYEHPGYRRDGRELDLNYPEALVYKTSTKRLQTVMYILEPGKTMDDVPDIAGNLTVWHGHSNLCWKSTNPDDPGYLKLDGVAIGGVCLGGGSLRVEPPMLHVWVVDNPCGPFAGTDLGNRTGSCVSH